MPEIKQTLELFLQTALEDNKLTNVEKSTIIKNIVDSEKALAETEKAEAETVNAKKPQPKEGAKLLISTIAPLITALALIATLWFQINQSKTSASNQIKSAEDASWREMLKQISLSTKDSNSRGDLTLPTLIKSFYNSPTYGSQAKEVGTLFLANISDQNYFKALFNEFVSQGNWQNINLLVTLSNILDTHASIADERKLIYLRDQFDIERYYVNEEIIRLLKIKDSTRPKVIDLSGLHFSGENLDSVDFSGVILSGTQIIDCSVKNSDFSNLAEFRNARYQCVWDNTAWWRTSKLNRDLLSFLLDKFKKINGQKYYQSFNDTNDYTKSDNESYNTLLNSR